MTQKNMTQMFQGDVSLVKINEAPKIEFKKIPASGIIIAEGELTGHNHTITKEREETEVEFGQDEHGFYLKVANGNAVIKHQEHAPITLSPGIWFVGVQYEYDEVEARRVQD